MTRIKQIKRYKLDYILSAITFLMALTAGQIASGNIGIMLLSSGLLKLAFILLIVGDVRLIVLKRREFCHSGILSLFFLVSAFFWDISLSKSQNFQDISWGNATLGIIALNLSAIFWTVIFFTSFFTKRERNLLSILSKDFLPIVLICFSYIVFFFANYTVWFKLDSETYASSIMQNAGTWTFSLANMKPFLMGGHTSYAYAMLLTIGELLIPKFGIGIRVINLLISLAAIVSFYLIVDIIWDHNKKLDVFLTLIFTYAPLFYGISYLVSSDFPLLCFFTIFLFASFYEIIPLKWLMIVCVCFSKETGIFFVVGEYLGETISSYVQKKEDPQRRKHFISFLFDWNKINIYISTIAYLCVLLFGSSGWAKNFRAIFSPSDATGYDIPLNTYRWWHYPIFKTFECFFMNFYWLIWVLVIEMLVSVELYRRSRKMSVNEYLVFIGIQKRQKYYVPIFLTYLTFYLMGILYLTYIHYRYIQLGHLFYVLILGIVVDLIPRKKIGQKEWLLFPVLALFFIESFVLFDPVTFAFFKKFDAGNGRLVSTRQYWYITLNDENSIGYYWEAEDSVMAGHYLAEGTEYNRETIGLQRVLEKSFTDIDYKSDKLIVLNNIGGWIEYTCGELFGVMDAGGWFWDPDYKTVVRYDTGIPITFVTDDVDLRQYQMFNEIYYFDLPFNEFHSSNILQNNAYFSMTSESCGRWKIDIYQLK